jgi:hypothetical protein
MSTITINVTIKNGALDVEDHGAPIQVPRGTDATNLVWMLTGSAASGSFNALSGPNPGFSWLPPGPPANIFSLPSRSANGNQISVSDGNTGASTGTWCYKLYATVNGVQYSTTSTVSPTATTNDPAIRNN